MAIIEVKIGCRCDTCGRLFSVKADVGEFLDGLPGDDLAERAIEEGADYSGPKSGRSGSKCKNFEMEHLCGVCADIEIEEDD